MTLNRANRGGCFVALVVTLVLVLEAVLDLHGQEASVQPRSARKEVINLAARGEYAAADHILAEELRKDPANFAILYNRALVNFFWKRDGESSAITEVGCHGRPRRRELPGVAFERAHTSRQVSRSVASLP